jgi:hypothetical protein
MIPFQINPSQHTISEYAKNLIFHLTMHISLLGHDLKISTKCVVKNKVWNIDTPPS